MTRFVAIEGLRAWLAWAVVLDHVANWSGFRGLLGELLRHFGYTSVMIFVVVSGVVITNLIIERPEPYRHYLLRRFMRLYPLFVVACILGYFVYPLPLQAPGFDLEYTTELQGIIASEAAHFWGHLAAHAAMLHGAIPHNLLPFSELTFSMFAWSVSLEWQFYLIALFVIASLVRWPARAAITLAIFFAVTQLLFKRDWSAAMLLETGEFFAVGIASRLLYPVLAGKIKVGIALACVIVVYALLAARAGALDGVLSWFAEHRRRFPLHV